MNKENLLNMAGYLDQGVPDFRMNNFEYCVLGWSGLAIQGRNRSFYDANEVHSRAWRLFGITANTPEWDFCFGARWGAPGVNSDAKAAAVRLRYVAQHGAAPSEDQWDRFLVYPTAPIVVEDESEEEILEFAGA